MRPSRRRRHSLVQRSGAIVLIVGTLAGTLLAPSPAGAAVAAVGSTSDGSSLSRSSIALARPSGAREGHLLLAAVAVNDGALGFVAPPGWSLVRQDQVGADLRQAVYVKVAGDSEPGAYVWRLPTISLRRLAGGLTAYSGVDLGSPVDAHGAGTGSGTAVGAPSIGTTVDGALLVHLAAVSAQGTVSPPPGMTERFEASSPKLGSSRGVVVASADVSVGSAGQTGGRTATASQAGSHVGALLALRPPAPHDPDPNPRPDPSPDPSPPGRMLLGWHQDGDVAGEMTEIEATLGKGFGMVRSYSSSWARPGRMLTAWAKQGKFVLWSVKPADDPNYSGAADPKGRILSWRASAGDIAAIDAQVGDLQAIAVGAGVPHIAYIVNHEPHDQSSDWDSRLDRSGIQAKCTIGDPADPCYGTNRDFRDLYATVRRRIDALGADRVLLTYVGVAQNMAADSGAGVGSGDPMYPGDDVVDLLGTDPYNWGCFRDCTWRSFERISASSIDLAIARDKRLVIAETASHMGCALLEGANGCNRLAAFDRDVWFLDMANFLTSDADARRYLIGFSYYHADHGDEDWRFVDHHAGGDPSGQLQDVDNRGLAGYLAGFVRDSVANGDNAAFFASTMFAFGLDPTP